MGSSIAVIGGGSWGTALVNLLSGGREQIHWWIRRQSQIDHILEYGRNPSYLSYAELDPSQLIMSNDLHEVVEKADYLILAVPAAFIHQTLKDINPLQLKSKVIISAAKGIIPEYRQMIPDYLSDRFNIPHENIGVIAGPCHSEEVAMKKLSYLTLAFNNLRHLDYIRSVLQQDFLQITPSDDVEGVGLASVLKNVYGIAAGICNGLGYGDNFQAVLTANALSEINDILEAVKPRNRNITDSAYAGDLMVTAYSKFSRNWMFGNLIGKGYSVKSAMMELKMVAEGYYASESITSIVPGGLNTPVLDAVHKILHENSYPTETISTLSSLIR